MKLGFNKSPVKHQEHSELKSGNLRVPNTVGKNLLGLLDQMSRLCLHCRFSLGPFMAWVQLKRAIT